MPPLLLCLHVHKPTGQILQKFPLNANWKLAEQELAEGDLKQK